MATKRSADRASTDHRRSVDRDGVVKVELRHGGRDGWLWFFGLAVAAALVGLVIMQWGSLGAPQTSGGRPPRGNEQQPGAAVNGGERSPQRAAPRMAVQPKEVAALAQAGASDDSEATGEPEAAGEPDSQPEDMQAEAPQERTGIKVFPAPGTKQIKRGIVVPDDFELPPGYVRHFQTTDKGLMLPSILMFHPDHKPLDADGNPVPLPPDRVVPPEMAPPGLPVELLDIPADAYANSEEDGADSAE